VSLWLGPKALVDFKHRAFRMSPREFAAAYEATGGRHADRASDTTPAQVDWILANLGPPPLDLLEIGSGKGALTARLRAAGHDVLTVDIHPSQADRLYLQGTVDSIPLPDKSVDVIILAHVIEHAPSLTKAFLELERVARRRVLIVTPKQRFFRWTFDYHLHFFYSLDHLASHAHRGKTSGVEADGDLCLIWDVSESRNVPARHILSRAPGIPSGGKGLVDPTRPSNRTGLQAQNNRRHHPAAAIRGSTAATSSRAAAV
jgi:SAM-dependent methyltransferase